MLVETRTTGSLSKSRRIESTPSAAGTIADLLHVEVDVQWGQEFRTRLDIIPLQSI